MSKSPSDTTQVHQCSFQANISHTNASVRFSCKMFLAWKSMSNKTFCRTSNHSVAVQDGVATFNQNLSITTYLLYDRLTQRYLKKQTSMCLMLISARKPDQQKLVGRVLVDLGQILNDNIYKQAADHKLNFCSIPNATLTFSLVCTNALKVDIKPMDLDMDQYSSISRVLNQSGVSSRQQALVNPLSQSSKDNSIDRDRNIYKMKESDVISEKPKVTSVGKSQQNSLNNSQNNSRLKQQQRKTQVEVQQKKQQNLLQSKNEQKLPRFGGSIQKNQRNQILASFGPNRDANKIFNIQNDKQKNNQFRYTDQQQIILDTNIQPLIIIESSQRMSPIQQLASQRQNVNLQNTHRDNSQIYNRGNEQSQNNEISNKAKDQIFQLQFKNSKLQGQNTKLFQLLQQANRSLAESSQDIKKLKKKCTQYQDRVNELKANLEATQLKNINAKNENQRKMKDLQNQKNDVIQQLLHQAQQSAKKCIQLQQIIKITQNTQQNQHHVAPSVSLEQVAKLKKKLEKLQKQYEQSERVRLDTQSELLQIRYQISQIKSQNQQLYNKLRQKQDQLLHLKKKNSTEQVVTPRMYDQIDRDSSMKNSTSLVSERDREGYNQEVEKLKKKLNKLLGQLQFTDSVKESLLELNNAFGTMSQQRQILINQINYLKQSKNRLQKQSLDKQSQQIPKKLQHIKTEPKQLDISTKLQVVQQQLIAVRCLLQRNESQTIKLQDKNKNLMEENQIIKQELYRQEGQLGNLRKENQLKQELISKLKQQKMSIQKQQENLQKQQGKNQQQIASLKQDIQSQKSQQKKLQSQLSTKSQQLLQKSQQLQKKQQQLQLKCQQLQINSQQLTAKSQQLQKTKQAELQKQVQLQSVQKKFEDLERAYRALEAQYKMTINALKRNENQVAQYKNIVNSLDNEKNKLSELNKNHIRSVEDLTNQLQHVKNRYNKLSSQHKALQQAKAKLQESKPSSQPQEPQKTQPKPQSKFDIHQLTNHLQNQELLIIELKDKIAHFEEKQAKMRANIIILEEESRKIYDIVTEKEQLEEETNHILQIKNIQIEQLKLQLSDLIGQNQILNEQLNQYKRQTFNKHQPQINTQTNNREGSQKFGKESRKQSIDHNKVLHQGGNQQPMIMGSNNQISNEQSQFIRFSGQRIRELEELLMIKEEEVKRENQIRQQVQQRLMDLEEQLKGEDEIRNQIMHQLQIQLNQTRNSVNNMREEISNIRLEKERVQMENNNLKYKLQRQAQSRKSMEQVHQLRKSLSNQINKNELEQKISNLEAKQTQNRANLLKRDQVISQLQKKQLQNKSALAKKDKAISQFQQRQKQLQAQVLERDQIIGQFQANQAGLREHLSTLERAYCQLEKKDQDLIDSLGAKDNFIMQLQGRQTEYVESINKYRRQINQLYQVLSGKQLQVAALTKTIELNKHNENISNITPIQDYNTPKNDIDGQSKQHQYIVELQNQRYISNQLQNKLRQCQQDAYRMQTAIMDYKAKQQHYNNTIKQQDALIFHLTNKSQDAKQSNQQDLHSINNQLQNRNQELINELAFHQDRMRAYENEIQSLQNLVNNLNSQIKQQKKQNASLKSQIDDNQVQKMNVQLQKHFQLVKQKAKGQSKANNQKSSLSYPDIIQACRCLQSLVKQRSQKDKSESIIQLMVSKNALLEDQLNKITQQRGIIQENARKLSMEFQKIKFKILKGKGSYQEKNQILLCLKPCEGKVKDLVQLAERLSDNQIQIQND